MLTTPHPKAVVIADPVQAFTEQDKFYIDQYLMRGGNLLWLIDPVQVSLDSLSQGETTIAFPRDLNLNDQLFRYGVRLNTNLVQDVDCLIIPVNTSPDPSNPKFTPAPWYYSPLLNPSQSHELSRNLNRVKGRICQFDRYRRQKPRHQKIGDLAFVKLFPQPANTGGSEPAKHQQPAGAELVQ